MSFLSLALRDAVQHIIRKSVEYLRSLLLMIGLDLIASLCVKWVLRAVQRFGRALLNWKRKEKGNDKKGSSHGSHAAKSTGDSGSGAEESKQSTESGQSGQFPGSPPGTNG